MAVPRALLPPSTDNPRKLRRWWNRLSPHQKALVVAATGTAAGVGLWAIVSALRSPEVEVGPLTLGCGLAKARGKLLGLDVSKFQRKIDWDKVCRNGLVFGFAKATQDTHITDSKFERNWEEMGRIGIYRGAYHFGVPYHDGKGMDWPAYRKEAQRNPKGTAKQQAEHFFETVGPLDGPKDLPPVLDLEWLGQTKQYTADWAMEYLERMEQLGGRTQIVYTGTNFLKNKMATPEAFTRYMFWQAYWSAGKEPGSSYPGLPWTFWQFTAKGSLPGIKGNVDLDVFYGTVEQLDQVARGAVLPPR